MNSEDNDHSEILLYQKTARLSSLLVQIKVVQPKVTAAGAGRSQTACPLLTQMGHHYL